MSKFGIKPLSFVSVVLAAASWYVARLQQEQDIDQAVDKWFKNNDPLLENPDINRPHH